jgi:hypothetical protein
MISKAPYAFMTDDFATALRGASIISPLRNITKLLAIP